jgi:hypothetical protein
MYRSQHLGIINIDGSLSEGHQDHLKNAFDLFECPSSQSLGNYHP